MLLRRPPGDVSSNTSSSPRKRLTADVQSIDEQLRKLKLLRGSAALTKEEGIDILFVYFTINKEYLNLPEPASALMRTSKIVGRSIRTVSKVVQSWCDGQCQSNENVSNVELVTKPNSRGQKTIHQTSVPNTPAVKALVRDFVMEKRLCHERVTARQMLDLFVEKGLVNVPTMADGIYTASGLSSALRAVQRYLVRAHFLRGNRRGKVALKPKNIAWLHRYLRAIAKNASSDDSERLRLVFLEESYIHHHYCRREYSIYDPYDLRYDEPKKNHKGRRYCIAAAIQGPGRYERAGLVRNTPWIFCPTSKGASSGDYHKNFNSLNFTEWFRTKLIPNLSEKSLIVLENAAYHKAKPPSTPKPNKMRKSDVLLKLQEYGISYDEEVSSMEAKILLREHIERHVPIDIVKIAEDHGHRVLFTPPYFSDLQPIELVWAFLKGNVGRKYSSSTTMKDVLDRLNFEFDYLTTIEGGEVISSIISHVGKKVDDMLRKMNMEDVAYERSELEKNEEYDSDSTVPETDTLSEPNTSDNEDDM